MTATKTKGRRPAITIARSEHARLSNLADMLAERDPHAAEQLAAELDRAKVVDDARMAPGVMRIGSTAEFQIDEEAPQTAELVFPKDADISRQRISVLTPVGAALLGLSAGQSIEWAARDGRVRRLQVIAVHAGAPDTARAS
ncbi:nucleoside diphosphate kinase regulator [Shinella zoogloeoides]|jgi:regulator of nucleoside diphosphate kinase|uniref:Nucleoside diphosphate kinase regulator n=1 Tax=Shinella zoogloeoides TaxID=352475 RepID=A0A6N8TFC1_SHIZO|nr:nucleoside diphosphate kinase regulator [Shinella zoogloeoides]MXO01952.1 nucleoside diphosphate kinase regulator [Shinella zoogloeoides]UEX81586.1 nucleoside diphosphate kinase regulator [Shinella zoogloeoides]